MSVWGALEGLDRTVSGRTAAKLMKSAVSDGGEDQGAEEAFMGPRENRFRPFWKPSLVAHGSPFSGHSAT